MKLRIQCKNCQVTNWLPQYAESRSELKKTFGDSIEVTCRKCGSKLKYSTNEITAKSRLIPLIAFALLCLGFYLSFKYLPNMTFGSSNLQSNYLILPFGLIITGLVFGILLRSEEMNKKNFNRSV